MEYLALKKRLFSEFALYQVFERPIEEIAIERAAELAQGLPEYEPLLFDTLLRDLAVLMDRCVRYRSDGMSLEIQAVKAFADYALFVDTSDIELQIDILAMQMPSSEKQIIASTNAATVFRNQEAPLSQGFEAEASGRSSVATAILATSQERERLLRERLSITRQYHDQYFKRHTEAGNAHNYRERMERTVEHLSEDLAEALAKANAIFQGMHSILGYSYPPPIPKDGRVIDELIRWARYAFRHMEKVAQEEVEFDVIIPLSQPWSGESALLEKDKLQDLINTKADEKNIEFDVSSRIFKHDNLRLRSVSVSFGNRSSSFINGVRTSDFALNYVLSGEVHTPPLTIDGLERRRPPISIGNIQNYAVMKEMTRTANAACQNVSPVGTWQIKLKAWAVDDNAEKTRIEDRWHTAQVIQDLKLHLRLAGIPKRTAR